MSTRILIAAVLARCDSRFRRCYRRLGGKAAADRDRLPPKVGTFVLTPLTPGPILPDAGTYAACCWTRRPLIRDGESMEIDNPTVSFTSKRGTFIWHERITYVDSNNDYTVATAVWTITHGTGAYAHLEGHGSEAAVNRTTEVQEVAAKAEGLVDLGP